MADKPMMWRLDLSPYEFVVRVDGKAASRPYDVKGSYATVLFNPALQLTVPQAFEAKELIDRISEANGSLLLDKQDYMRLQRSVDALRAPAIEDLELLRRIRDAEKVEVEAK